jgi:hypothetical protein
MAKKKTTDVSELSKFYKKVRYSKFNGEINKSNPQVLRECIKLPISLAERLNEELEEIQYIEIEVPKTKESLPEIEVPKTKESLPEINLEESN